MVVLITNVTDVPGGKHSPTQVDIYNKTLGPGASLKIPAELVNTRVRALADQGLIAIGALPSWYTAAKARTGRRLSAQEKQNRFVIPAPPPPAPNKAWRMTSISDLEKRVAMNSCSIQSSKVLGQISLTMRPTARAY